VDGKKIKKEKEGNFFIGREKKCSSRELWFRDGLCGLRDVHFLCEGFYLSLFKN
jgi:hypothetical protein